MLQKYLTRMVSTAACGALAFLSALASAQPQNLSNKDLYSFLAKSSASGILRGSDVKKYPKLAAILGMPPSDAAIAPYEFQQRFDQYVSSHALLFVGLDANKDGKVSVLEVAQRLPKLLVYFPYLDLNGDGALTFDELLSSRLVFNLSKTGGSKSLSQGANASNADVQLLQRPRFGDESLTSGDGKVSSYDAFVANETARLEAFFARDTQKDDPVVVEPVVITGSNYQSSSGFYPTYGMWVNKQDALAVDADFTITTGMLCRAACWGVIAGGGCVAATAACAGATTITLGGFAVPCTVFVAAVCISANGAASICSDLCPAG